MFRLENMTRRSRVYRKIVLRSLHDAPSSLENLGGRTATGSESPCDAQPLVRMRSLYFCPQDNGSPTHYRNERRRIGGAFEAFVRRKSGALVCSFGIELSMMTCNHRYSN